MIAIVLNQLALTLLPAVTGLLGVIITLLVTNNHNRKQMLLKIEELKLENELRVKERTFNVGLAILPKTLIAIQDAFTHLMSINHLLNNASGIVSSQTEILDVEKKSDELHDTIKAIRSDWYDKNCIYLPSKIRSNFVKLLNMTHLHLMELFEGLVGGANRDIWTEYFNNVENLESMLKDFMDKYNLLTLDKDI